VQVNPDGNQKDKKSIKVWYREEQEQQPPSGPILPSLDSRPISKSALEKIHCDHSGQRPPDPQFSYYSQPLPRARYANTAKKLKDHRFKLVQKLKIQRELFPGNMSEDCPLLDFNNHRLVKTADILSIFELTPFILPEIPVKKHATLNVVRNSLRTAPAQASFCTGMNMNQRTTNVKYREIKTGINENISKNREPIILLELQNIFD
jgi:hypothetical protein